MQLRDYTFPYTYSRGSGSETIFWDFRGLVQITGIYRQQGHR
jgi:hypothetical protein